MTSSGRISIHPPLPTTTCSPRAEIFPGVGVTSIITLPRGQTVLTGDLCEASNKSYAVRKEKKAFHGRRTEYLLCNTHTLSTTDLIRLDCFH